MALAAGAKNVRLVTPVVGMGMGPSFKTLRFLIGVRFLRAVVRPALDGSTPTGVTRMPRTLKCIANATVTAFMRRSADGRANWCTDVARPCRRRGRVVAKLPHWCVLRMRVRKRVVRTGVHALWENHKKATYVLVRWTNCRIVVVGGVGVVAVKAIQLTVVGVSWRNARVVRLFLAKHMANV